MANWFQEDDTLALKTPNQYEFISSTPCAALLQEYSLFKVNGRLEQAQEIKERINDALDLIHERDTGTTSQAPRSLWSGPRLV